MINFSIALLIAVLVTVHLRVPFALLQMSQTAQVDFDRQIFSSAACRSTFDSIRTRKFNFFQENELPCYFERIDFGTVETKGHWPKSVCFLIDQTHDTTSSVGAETCSYQ